MPAQRAGRPGTSRRGGGSASRGGSAGSRRAASTEYGARATVTDDLPGDPEQDLGDPEAVARAVCLRMLTQRARSRAELAGALTARGVPDGAAATVLDRFTEVGLIDDTALAVAMAGSQHRERGLARRAIVQKLRQRGLDDESVEVATAAIDTESERTRARALVEKKLRSLSGLPPQVQQRRLFSLLARKGYPSGVAYDVVRSVVTGANADDPVPD